MKNYKIDPGIGKIESDRKSPMVDKVQFLAFFKKMGVEHDTLRPYGGTKGYGKEYITVSQAHFWFDKDGNYVGVEDDEMGNFRPREVKK